MQTQPQQRQRHKRPPVFKGVRVIELAKEAKVSHAHISYIMSGKRVPSLSVAARIAQHVGCSIDELYKTLSKTSKTQAQAA